MQRGILPEQFHGQAGQRVKFEIDHFHPARDLLPMRQITRIAIQIGLQPLRHRQGTATDHRIGVREHPVHRQAQFGRAVLDQEAGRTISCAGMRQQSAVAPRHRTGQPAGRHIRRVVVGHKSPQQLGLVQRDRHLIAVTAAIYRTDKSVSLHDVPVSKGEAPSKAGNAAPGFGQAHFWLFAFPTRTIMVI